MPRLRNKELPKLYYPTPDELQGAKPLVEGFWNNQNNHGTWFDVYQPLLLRLANTNEGRDLLCLDSFAKRPYQIMAIRKNYVKYHLGSWDEQEWYLSDFRIGAKWGNVIRYRWQYIKAALDRMNLEILLAYPRLVLPDGRQVPMISGATTTTFYPDPNPESTTVDGEVGEISQSESWSDIRGGPGTRALDNTTPLNMQVTAYSTTNNWRHIQRGIFLYDTSPLGADNIASATHEFVAGAKVDNFSDSMALVLSTPASNTALVNADYTEIGTGKQATNITIASITIDGSTYNAHTLDSTGRASIEKSGVTKLGMRQESDRANSEPTWGSNQNTSSEVYSADASGTSTDVKLAVVHTAPFTPRAIMF
jgi:hypothetical protein